MKVNMENNPYMVLHGEINTKEIIVCLFDGDYYLGAAGLINSIAKSGFKGLIYAGYRGKKPIWVNQLEALSDYSYYITEDIILNLKKVDTTMHLGYYKPFFIKETFEIFKSINKVYYFDADIVIKAPWTSFSEWLDIGVCVCIDCSFHFVHTNHPWRKQWKSLAPLDIKVYNDNVYYFNSGFIGIERNSVALIDRWIYYTEKYLEIGGNKYGFNKDDYNSIKGDQDLFNAAITISPDIEISIVGKEGMGFSLPATFMVHAIGDIKPWKNFFLKQLLKSGNKPSIADKAFFLHSIYPITIFPKFIYLVKKFDLFHASVWGRLLG
jgi:hypothetical protein